MTQSQTYLSNQLSNGRKLIQINSKMTSKIVFVDDQNETVNIKTIQSLRRKFNQTITWTIK